MLKTNAAHWCNHPNAVQAAPLLRTWLTDPGSMTVKLKARCQQFRVQRLRQQSGNALRDESHLLGLTPRQRVVERDVILYWQGLYQQRIKALLRRHRLYPRTCRCMQGVPCSVATAVSCW